MSIYSRIGRPLGVLWDMDGTIIDSEPEWERATREVVEGLGASWSDEDARLVVGVANDAHAARMAEACRRCGVADFDTDTMMADIFEIVRDHVANQVELIPGVAEIMCELIECRIPQVLVTSSPRILAETVTGLLVRELGINPFNATVDGDEGIPGKPDPRPYVLAAERIRIPASGCVAFEDSVYGLESARLAGCRVIDVNQTPLAVLARKP